MIKKSKITISFFATLIIIWPLIFTFGLGYAERVVKTHSTQNFDPRYLIIILVLYILAGAIFAFIGTTEKNILAKSYYW